MQSRRTGERLKCVLQVQSANPTGPKFSGPMEVAKHLYKEGGWMSLNRGFTATFARDACVPAPRAPA